MLHPDCQAYCQTVFRSWLSAQSSVDLLSNLVRRAGARFLLVSRLNRGRVVIFIHLRWLHFDLSGVLVLVLSL